MIIMNLINYQYSLIVGVWAQSVLEVDFVEQWVRSQIAKMSVQCYCYLEVYWSDAVQHYISSEKLIDDEYKNRGWLYDFGHPLEVFW